MSDKSNNTFTEYLGTHFQLKLFWQILTEPEFAEKIINNLNVDYFDDLNYKKLFLTITQYYEEYGHIPNINNKSIYHAIKKFNSSNSIEEEIITEIIKQIVYWNESVLNQKTPYDGDIIQKETFVFIKQQEYRKISEQILRKVRTGEIKSKKVIHEIEEEFSKINRIGDEENYGVVLTENIKSAFDKDFRQTIPTGIKVIDELTAGGLGKGEIGLILAASGVGKSTILTKIANSALEDGKNVLQIIFEDTEDEIRRKHFTIWSKIPLSELSERKEEAEKIITEKIKSIKNKLIIKKFDEDETTLIDIKNWIESYQKKFGIKFDMVVLDYLDCLDSHKKTTDQNQAELAIVKMLISMASKMDIPIWSALQANRQGFNAELIDQTQMGGSIKRAQKTHFLMSIAKTADQKRLGTANISILKARFASDGHIFKDCIFNNNTMEIRILENLPKSKTLSNSNITPESLDRKLDKISGSSLFDMDEINKMLNGDKKDDDIKPVNV